MELFAPMFDDEGNLAVNPDGTLACRPLTGAEQADLADALHDELHDAALEAAHANDPVQREPDACAVADLANEFSGPAYDLYWGEDG